MLRISALLLATLLLNACASNDSAKYVKERKAILEMRYNVLQELYKEKPSVEAQVKAAPGTAVFSNANVKVLFASFGGGKGVVVNNQTQKRTFMNMGEVGVGLGVGVKDLRVVFVFHNEETMNRFIEQGWSFGAQADVAAKAADQGEAIGGAVSAENMSIYQLTESGLALQATISGTRYWKDEELN